MGRSNRRNAAGLTPEQQARVEWLRGVCVDIEQRRNQTNTVYHEELARLEALDTNETTKRAPEPVGEDSQEDNE